MHKRDENHGGVKPKKSLYNNTNLKLQIKIIPTNTSGFLSN